MTNPGGRSGRSRYVADVVLACDESFSIFTPGAVEVEDGRIAWVGPAASHPERHADVSEQRLDGLLMPGLVNVHCHSPMTLFRGAGEDVPLDRWLQEVLWPRETRITPEDTYWGMAMGAAELLRGGVTTTCEMYWFEDAIAQAARDAGIRCLITPGVIDAPAWCARFGTWEQQVERITSVRAQGGDGLVDVGFGPHAAYTLPLEALKAVAEAARASDALLHIHLAETRGEGAALEEEHGRSVPALLADAGVFDGRVLAAHCVWLSDDDLDLLRRHDVAVAHCPQSNAKLASGIARLSDMLARGIRVGLGTDGPASNNDLDLWEEMRLAPMLARARSGDPQLVPSRQALTLATRGGGAALGRSDVGALAVGRQADMILLSTDHPTFVPVVDPGDIVAHTVWSASSRLVTDVWVAGRHVVEDGVCTTVDEAEARRQVQDRAVRLADEARAGG